MTPSDLSLSLPVSFKDLVDALPEVLIVHDMENRVLFWNQLASDVYGWTLQEIRGQSVSRILYLDGAARNAAVAELMDTGHWSGLLRQVDRKGDAHFMQVRQRLHRCEHGEPMAVVSFNTDITEQKKQEAAEEQAHYVRSSNLLAGGFAHELNNALAPIMLSAAMLKRSLEEPKALNFVAMIEKSATRGAEIIADLLSFERGKGGGSDWIRRPQVARSLQRIGDAIIPENVRVDWMIADDLWDYRGEMSELLQAFKSVVQNACDAMPGGGSLQIRVANRRFDTNAHGRIPPQANPGPYVSFVFKDDGIGIEASQIQRVAEPFFTTKEPKEGFGFGLTNAQAIVKGHKGFISIESELGKGTAVTILLPAHPSAEQRAAETKKPLRGGA